MADTIVILRDGYIEQQGSPLEVYDKPANLFVAEFIGSPSMNLMKGEVTADGMRMANGTLLPLPEGSQGEARPEDRLWHQARAPHARRRNAGQGQCGGAHGPRNPHLCRPGRPGSLRHHAGAPHSRARGRDRSSAPASTRCTSSTRRAERPSREHADDPRRRRHGLGHVPARARPRPRRPPRRHASGPRHHGQRQGVGPPPEAQGQAPGWRHRLPPRGLRHGTWARYGPDRPRRQLGGR